MPLRQPTGIGHRCDHSGSMTSCTCQRALRCCVCRALVFSFQQSLLLARSDRILISAVSVSRGQRIPDRPVFCAFFLDQKRFGIGEVRLSPI